MKNSIRIISIPVILFLILIISRCEEKTKIRAGGVSDLYSFIPEDVSGFLLLNVDKFSKLESYEKMFQEDKAVMAPPGYAMFKNYHDFVRKTGIDPKKDIHSIAFLLFEGSDDKEKSVVVSRSDYTKEKVIELIKREGGKFSAEKYHDMDLFRFTVENEEIGLSFIDEKTIIGGCPERVKQVIDLSKGKGKNILSDKARNLF